EPFLCWRSTFLEPAKASRRSQAGVDQGVRRANPALQQDRQFARPDQDVLGCQAVELPNGMTEVGGIRIAHIQGDVGKGVTSINVVKQASGALPGAELAESDTQVFLEQMKETGKRQTAEQR